MKVSTSWLRKDSERLVNATKRTIFFNHNELIFETALLQKRLRPVDNNPLVPPPRRISKKRQQILADKLKLEIEAESLALSADRASSAATVGMSGGALGTSEDAVRVLDGDVIDITQDNTSAGDIDEITYWGTSSSSSSSSVIVNDHSESVQNTKVPNVSADVTSTTVTSLGSTVTKSTEHTTLPIDGKNMVSSDVPEASAPMLLFDEEVCTSCVFHSVSFHLIVSNSQLNSNTIYLSTKMTAENNDCHTIFAKYASRKS